MRVALTNGVHVLVTGRATDTDADVMRQAVYAGGGRDDPSVTIDWILSESEVQSPPAVWDPDALAVAKPSMEQVESLETSIRALQAQMVALQQGEARGTLSPIQEARLDERRASLIADIEGARMTQTRLRAGLGGRV
jgi:hypothetical protein